MTQWRPRSDSECINHYIYIVGVWQLELHKNSIWIYVLANNGWVNHKNIVAGAFVYI